MQSDIIDFSRRPDLFRKLHGEWHIKVGCDNEALDWIDAEQAKVRAMGKELREQRRLLRQARRKRDQK